MPAPDPAEKATPYIARIRVAKNRDEAAEIYYEALCTLDPNQHFGSDTWRPINMAIVTRWSMSGLRYVKEKAWKLASPK